MKVERETMKDLNEQKMSLLQSELGQVRHEIKSLQDYGFDTITFNFSLWFILKVYFGAMAILFLGIGLFEESMGHNTKLNKWL